MQRRLDVIMTLSLRHVSAVSQFNAIEEDVDFIEAGGVNSGNEPMTSNLIYNPFDLIEAEYITGSGCDTDINFNHENNIFYANITRNTLFISKSLLKIVILGQYLGSAEHCASLMSAVGVNVLRMPCYKMKKDKIVQETREGQTWKRKRPTSVEVYSCSYHNWFCL